MGFFSDLFGGGDDKPRDYNNEALRKADEENRRRAAYAKRYNDAVRNYNRRVNWWDAKSQDFASTIGGLDINSIDDSKLKGQIDYGLGRLRGWNLNVPRPEFSPSATYYQIPVTLNQPSLLDPADKTAVVNRLTNSLSQWQDLWSQRRKARDEATNQRRTFHSQYDRFRDELNRAWNQEKYYDQSWLDQGFSTLADLDAAVDLYQAPVIEDRPSFEGLQTRYGNLLGRLQKGQERYNTEEQRIEDFMRDMTKLGSRFDRAISGYDIRDIDAINNTERQVLDAMRKIGVFDPKIEGLFDAESGLSQFRSMQEALDMLQEEHKTETARIRSAEQEAQDTLARLGGDIRDLDIYEGSGFGALEGTLEEIRRGLGGFESQLALPFADELAQVEDLMGQLGTKRQEREESLADILSRAGEIGTGAEALELYDEEGLDKALEDLLGMRGELGRFTGDIGDYERQFSDIQNALEGRYTQLEDYRGDLEQRAQDLLTTAGETPYYFLGDVERMRGRYDPLAAEVEQYQAGQARDELEDILSLLDTQTSRLNQSAAEREARVAAESGINSPYGIDRAYIESQLQNDTLTPDEYMALIARVEQRDPQYAADLLSRYGHLFAAA